VSIRSMAGEPFKMLTIGVVCRRAADGASHSLPGRWLLRQNEMCEVQRGARYQPSRYLLLSIASA
jgi:hypothetical protein